MTTIYFNHLNATVMRCMKRFKFVQLSWSRHGQTDTTSEMRVGFVRSVASN